MPPLVTIILLRDVRGIGKKHQVVKIEYKDALQLLDAGKAEHPPPAVQDYFDSLIP